MMMLSGCISSLVVAARIWKMAHATVGDLLNWSCLYEKCYLKVGRICEQFDLLEIRLFIDTFLSFLHNNI